MVGAMGWPISKIQRRSPLSALRTRNGAWICMESRRPTHDSARSRLRHRRDHDGRQGLARARPIALLAPVLRPPLGGAVCAPHGVSRLAGPILSPCRQCLLRCQWRYGPLRLRHQPRQRLRRPRQNPRDRARAPRRPRSMGKVQRSCSQLARLAHQEASTARAFVALAYRRLERTSSQIMPTRLPRSLSICKGF